MRSSKERSRQEFSSEKMMVCLRLLLLISTFLFGCCSTSFIETPSPITAEYESGIIKTVIFWCRHDQTDAIIWKLNGNRSRDYDGVVDSSVRENGILVGTLTVPVIPAYNGSEVVCSALVEGSFVETPAAVLTITASSATTPLTTTPPPTTPPPTTSPPTTSSPTPPAIPTTTTSTGGFVTTPSLNIVAMELGRVTFNCKHSTGTDIFWSVDAPSGDRIVTSMEKVDLPGGGVASNLTMDTLLEYNQTSVECRVEVDGGSTLQYTRSPVANLLIQGIPGNVNNLNCVRPPSTPTILTTHWDSVFSLDLNDTEPDIVYEFEVYDITCGRNDLIHYDTVMVNSTSNTIDPAQIYKVVVAARNNVSNAVNGTGVDASEEFLMLDATMLFKLYTKKLANVTVTQDLPPLPVPRYYMVNLTSSDGSDLIITRNVTVIRKQDQIALWLNEGIPPRILWDASVSAYGCQEHMVEGIMLSTHEIQDVSVTTKSGEIRVIGIFVDGSTATGALIIVYSLTNDSDVRYITTGLEQRIDVNVRDLHGSIYGVSAFVLEDGVPFNRTVTMPKSVSFSSKDLKSHNSLVSEKSTSLSSSLQYEVQSTSTGVCITCTFLESSTTDCVAVVHQRISQLNSSGLMNIESSHKFTRSGDTASGCIEGVNLEDRQVGVVGVRQISPTTNSQEPLPESALGAIVGVVLALAVATALLIVIVSLILWRRRVTRKENNTYIEETTMYSEVRQPPGSSQMSTATFSISGIVLDCLTFRRKATTTPDDKVVATPNLESPPPVPTRTEESKILIDQELASTIPMESSITVGNDHPAVDPTYDTPAYPGTTSSPTATPQTQPQTPEQLRSTPGSAESSPPQGHVSSCGLASDQTGAGDPLYATPVESSHKKHPSSQDAIALKSQGLQYAMIAKTSTSTFVVDDLHKTATVYSKIQPQATPPPAAATDGAGKLEVEEQCLTTTTTPEPIPFDMEHLLPELMGVASKWQSLGEALSLDEDILDEIFTNNATDEECLRDMLERYLMRSDLKHSWEEINKALASIEKDILNGSDDNTECNSHLDHTPGQKMSTSDNNMSPGVASESDACSHVSQSVDCGANNTAVCVQTSKMPPTAIGGESDDRTSEAVQLSGSYDSVSLASSSPKSFSFCQEDPSCSPVQPAVYQETQNPDVDFMSAMRNTFSDIRSKHRLSAARHIQDFPTAASPANVCRAVHKTEDSPSLITHGTSSASAEGALEELPQKDKQVNTRKLSSRFSKQDVYQISQTCLAPLCKTATDDTLKQVHHEVHPFFTMRPMCAQKRYLIMIFWQ